jgi:hypothetical protein
MSAPAKGKAVARPGTEGLETTLLEHAQSPQERAAAFQLATQVRQTHMLREAAAAIAATAWGTNISPVARAAVARYCLEVGIDPVRHVFVLGGNVFINGTYYRDVVASNPEFDHSDAPVWLHADPRLAELAADEKADATDRAWARAELERRRRLRIEHNVPEDSPAACIVTLHYKNGRGPFSGIGQVHGGKVKTGANAGVKDRDPIGLENPRTTAETRAWREAGEKAEPVWFRAHPRLKAAEEILVEGRSLAPPLEPDLPEATAPEASGEPPAPKMVQHHITKLCAKEGLHPETECGYATRPAPAA